MLTPDELTTLELLVDTHGLRTVVGALADICDKKAAHILTSYCDRSTASVWRKHRNILVDAAAKVWVS